MYSVIEFLQTGMETIMYLGAVTLLISLLFFTKQRESLFMDDMVKKSSIEQNLQMEEQDNYISGANVFTNIVTNPVEDIKVKINGQAVDLNGLITNKPEAIIDVRDMIHINASYLAKSTYDENGNVTSIEYIQQ